MAIHKYSVNKKDTTIYYNFGSTNDSLTSESKQRINLSESAWTIIDYDRENFSGSNNKISFAGFLNTVFTNFYQTADASIHQRLMEKEEKLMDIYDSKEFDHFDKKTLNACFLKQCEIYENELIDKAFSHKKSETRSMSINKENMAILAESEEADYYESSRGNYLKSIFEEYATKPQYIRERIFFQTPTIDKIELAINKQRKLKITLQETVYNNTTYSPKFYVSPYKIIQDKSNMFNYLVGFSERINEFSNDPSNDKSVTQIERSSKQLSCFRISRIENIDIMKSMGAHISKEDEKYINNKILERGPQFLSTDISKIEVQFTKKGLESFKRILYMRPEIYTIDENDKYHYTFQCTEFQATNYFIRFGNKVKILSPSSLKEEFKEFYESALENYQ